MTPIRRALVLVALTATSAAALSKPTVALTRELGKNGKLAALLQERGFSTVETPCIAHTVGSDRAALPAFLREGGWTFVAVTSPEAATVLLQGWEEADKPPLEVASIGKSTSTVLRAAGVVPVFEPSKATAKTMVAELPVPAGEQPRILYPASAKAASTLQDGLTARGCFVARLDTYDTQPADWDGALTATAQAADLVTFASPSAVKVWVGRLGVTQPAACIGETSGAAARAAGFAHVRFPDKPGMDGWVAEIERLAYERC